MTKIHTQIYGNFYLFFIFATKLLERLGKLCFKCCNYCCWDPKLKKEKITLG